MSKFLDRILGVHEEDIFEDDYECDSYFARQIRKDNELKEKLFKEMITTKGKNGTGLGLYMSYSNIKAHFSGDISVYTKSGEGTTFDIILPEYQG